MSKYKPYARKLEELALGYFAEYKKALEEYNDAEQVISIYNRYNGNIPRNLLADYERAKIDLREATENLQQAKANLGTHTPEIKKLRDELEAEIDASRVVDPAKLDGATLELLKSGILNDKDYAHLFNKAKKDDNVTMARLIGKYAGEAAKGILDNIEATPYRLIEAESKDSGKDGYLGMFDSMADVVARAAKNPAMIDHWGELTSDTISNF